MEFVAETWGQRLKYFTCFRGIMWTLLYHDTLCQQQKALWGEQVGQGWGAVLWCLSASWTVRWIPDSSPCYFQALHRCAETPPWLMACNQASFRLLPQASSGLWGYNSLNSMVGEQIVRAYREMPAFSSETGFLSSYPTSWALCTRAKAVPPTGISDLSLPAWEVSLAETLPFPSVIWDAVTSLDCCETQIRQRIRQSAWH